MQPYTVTTEPSRDSLFTDFSKATMDDRYLQNGETYQGMFARVATRYGADQGHAQRIYDYMSKHWFMPATPILSNGGTGRGLPVSCFVNNVEDDLQGIHRTYSENFWLAASGGGIGTYWGNIRSIGEKIKAGQTSGVVPFIKIMDAYCLGVSQGGLRKGSGAAYLPINHPEVEDFCEMRRPTGGDPARKVLTLHHGVCITDDFMEAVAKDEEWKLVSPKTGETVKTLPARDLWVRLLLARLEQGEPYILFTDTVNRLTPQFQRDAGLKVTTSNLCVAGDTPILTKDGYQPIESLAGQDVELWNGEQWSLSRVEQTADNARLRKIVFSNGATLWTTDEHKFFVHDDDSRTIIEVHASDLKKGDRLESPASMPKQHDDLAVNGKAPHAYAVRVVSNGVSFKEEPTFCANEPIRHKIILNGVLTSNCSEILLPTGIDQYGKDRTAVCCLSSLNLEKWDEWSKHEGFVKDVLLFLDNVLQDFIDNATDKMERASYSAMRERSVGLGVMGFHAFLQSKNLPFGSAMSKVWNKKFFQFIHNEAEKANVELAVERGSCPDAQDMGVKSRFSCKTAVAPTASISIIAGTTSPGIDPVTANVFTQKTLSGSFTVRNRHLQKVLEKYGKDEIDVWTSIATNKGSVQHLDFLSDDEKDVFKTAFEIDQRWIVEMAADRATLIDQAQSVNLFLPGDVSKRELHALHFSAWEKGVKSLYYCRSRAVTRSGTPDRDVAADNVRPSTSADTQEDEDYEVCLSCQ